MTLHIREATDEERGKIERLTRARSAPVRLVARARIVQLALQGMTVPAIAQELGVSEKMVRLWLTRFEQDGLAGLDDAARSGRPRTYTEEYYSRVIALARGLPPKPDDGQIPPTCHWTLDRLQEVLAKQWCAHQAQPDPPYSPSRAHQVAEAAHLAGERRPGVRRKKGAIVGLYTAPPPGSTVICLDELGPVAAKSSPGPSWSDETHRPHFRPSYARHGYRWAFGALVHRTGAVCVATASTRDTAAWLHFLDG